MTTEDQALADRLVNYSDAIVALAFIVSSGLGLAIADPDTRDTIADVAGRVILGNAVFGVVYSALLIVLRRWEFDLRAGVTVSDKFLLYSWRIYLARHMIVWLSIAQTVAIMLALGD